MATYHHKRFQLPMTPLVFSNLFMAKSDFGSSKY